MNEKKYNRLVLLLSVALPLLVALLFSVNLRKMGFDVEPLTFLPPIYASINALTAVVLILAVLAIKQGKRKLHERLMKLAMTLSVLFLLMYVAYHSTADSTKFGGEGSIRYLYFFILITHICLSIVVIPFVLLTYVRAITERFEKHKQLARYAFPLWLYVAISGVIVYLMISPYYVS
jgi:putative membrane protein